MAKATYDLVIRGGLLLDEDESVSEHKPQDLAIKAGRIAAIGDAIDGRAEREIDASGLLVSPPFVESHIHLDSALIDAGRCDNKSGTLFEGIENWRKIKGTLTVDSIVERAIQTLKLQASHGILHVRTHADVSEPSQMPLKALVKVREKVKSWMDVQVVAFPQDGFYGHPDQPRRMEQSIRLGADVVGGIPHYELTREDGVNSIHEIFKLAKKYKKLIDVHCDEVDDPNSRFLEVMAACAIRYGNGPSVTASHTTAFGSYDNSYANKLMGFLKRAKINFVANPLINITLQGRADTYPKRRGLTRVKELWQAGLNVSFGYDCIMDPWYALGTGSMLDAAHMAVHCCQMMGKQEINACYNMVTYGGARTLSLKHYGLSVGNPANVVVLDATNRFDAIRKRSIARYVISRGKLIVENEPARTAIFP